MDPASAAEADGHEPIRPGDRVSAAGASALAGSLAAGVAAGLPLSEVLTALADDADDKRLVRIAEELAERTDRGELLDDALASMANRLPRELRGVLAAGAKSGRLAEVIEGFAAHQSERRNLTRTIRAAMVSPLLSIAVFIPFVLLFAWWIVPSFSDLYDEFELELPVATTSILEVAESATGILVALIGIPVFVFLVLRVFALRRLEHWIRGATPGWGRLWVWCGQFEFAAMLATMLENNLPLPDALESTADAIHDANVARSGRWVTGHVRAGRPLGETLHESIHFDPLIANLASWGESNGALPEALQLAADVLRVRVRYRAAILARLFPFLILLVIATSVVCFVVVALLLPLVDLIEGLSGF